MVLYFSGVMYQFREQLLHLYPQMIAFLMCYSIFVIMQSSSSTAALFETFCDLKSCCEIISLHSTSCVLT